jgi:hypothetical protein
VQLIYQQGGYWVYKIPGGKESEPSAQPAAAPAPAAPAPAGS